MIAHEIIADLTAWNAMLARHESVFASVTPGSNLGIVPQADATQRSGNMLVWGRAPQGGMTAELRPYVGYNQCGVDLLFVAEDQGLNAIYDVLAERPLEEMKAALRRGELCMFVTKRRDDLTEAGWDDLLETLGRAYMGLCR
jgi:hypothetical protein